MKQQDAQRSMFGIRVISEEEAESLQSGPQAEKQRLQNLRLLFQLRPGVFDPEDQAEAEMHQANIRSVVWWVMAGFATTTATRVWMIKTRSQSVLIGGAGILISYVPALIYYQKQQSQYSRFIEEVSERYKHRIRDDQLKAFKEQERAKHD